ncbi:MAG: ribosomal protein S18-alanine N-acetyltransferase [Bryobacteraceae bacterium]
MRQFLKRAFFGLQGKDPDAVVVSFRTADDALADAMCREVRELEPSRRHFTVSADEPWSEVKRKLRPYRIGIAPVLFTKESKYDELRSRALRLAPRKILAYNGRMERHHLKLTSPIASWLFLHGVPFDRIFLRPSWFGPFRREKTVRPVGHRVIEGRARNPRRKTVGVLTPYYPYPLSHGGAVRMFNLLREIGREFNVVLYAFTEGPIAQEDFAPVLEFTSRVYLVEKPRYREPRWSTVTPPEACEFWSPEMAKLVAARDTDLLQTEYTYLAQYGGDILVEHDVTYDLYAQVFAKEVTVSAWWNLWRWRRFETTAVSRFRQVVVMSEKDGHMLGIPQVRVIENGVDIHRFEPQVETAGRTILFIGSFRHFPNIVAYRYLTEQILPLVKDFKLIVVAGPEPWLHWRNHTGSLRPAKDDRIEMHEFVADVRPLYHRSNVVVVPTLESAGTNVKVLEAMAMRRAVVSTTSGVAGLGLEHTKNVWVADSPADFAAAIERLLGEEALRGSIAESGRQKVEEHFDWRAIGLRQRAMLRELIGDDVDVRPAQEGDWPAVLRIQTGSPEASQWEAADYRQYDCLVAVSMSSRQVIGFLASRQIAPDEREILNVAVVPPERGRGVGRRLLETMLAHSSGKCFLEVRQSNENAIRLYESLGFERVGLRENYYHSPDEPGIVMRVHSCYRHGA